MIALKPAELSHFEAASMPVVAVTAWQMLFDRAKVREGQPSSSMAVPAMSAHTPFRLRARANRM